MLNSEKIDKNLIKSAKLGQHLVKFGKPGETWLNLTKIE